MDFIPIVDISNLTNRNSTKDDWRSTSDEIFRALNGIGFVYVKNHGISPVTINRAFLESKKFYELPDSVKALSMKDISKSYNGYAKPGQESLLADAAFEIRESYDFCGTQRVYPDAADEFGPALEALEIESKPLIKNLLRALAISLDIHIGNEGEEFFVNRCKHLDDLSVKSFSTLRSLYYPPTWNNDKVKPGTVRCADHSDYGILTLLFQDEIGGLEVKAVNGEWVPATPVPDTVLVNTGDLLEFWSCGIFPATHHRVLIPEVELKQKLARQSIVFFVHPDDETLVSPMKTSKTSQNLKDYEPIRAVDHAAMRLAKSYNY